MNSEVKEGIGWLYGVYTPTSQEVIFNRIPALGTTRVLQDGRKFRFIRTAVDAVAGQVMGTPIALTEITSGNTAALVGDTQVEITRSGTTLNQLAGGFITFTNTAGVEATYGIVRNTAADADDQVVVYLDNPLVGAVAAGDALILIPPMYGACIINTAGTLPVGVAIRPSTAATDGVVQYMWVQYAGVGSLIITTALGLTDCVKVMATAAGSAVASDGTLADIGIMLNQDAMDNGDVAPCFLMIP